MKNFFVAALLIISITSCDSVKGSAAADPGGKISASQDALYSRKWYLSRIQNNEEITTVEGKKAYIQFSRSDATAGGNGGCNSFGATVSISGKKISFSDIASTEMYCEGVQALESLFFEQLSKVTEYEIRRNALFLFENSKFSLELSSQ